MEKEWIVIDVEIKGAFVDLVSAVLAECGSQGVLVEERQLDTFVVPDDELVDERTYRLQASFHGDSSADELIDQIAMLLSAMPQLQAQGYQLSAGAKVHMEDWAESWKQHFSSIHIGEKLIIRPSWEVCEAAPDVAVIEIDPGMAFGTGTHATTRLCLGLIEELLSTDHSLETMLDVGTGSGILALGAAALGCSHILANDIDSDVIRVAQDNISKNALQARITVTEKPLEQLDGTFDLVVANILAEENIRLRHEFVRCMGEGGLLILSGILKEKEALVRDSFSELELDYCKTCYDEEWVALLFKRR